MNTWMQSISTGFTLTVTRQWTAPWKRCCYLKTSQIHWDIHCFRNAGVHGVSYGVRHGVSHGVRYGVGHELGKGSVMGSVIGLVMGIVRRSQCQKSLFVAPLLTYHKGKVQSCQGSFRYKCILIKSKASNINQMD